MSFGTLDLNLLRVFDALMEERSVVRASRRVFLTQSAVSHSLARLRDALDDELFVRTAKGMQPTDRALAMAQTIREALRALETAVDPARFDPASSTKTFTIAASDFTTLVVVPRLLTMLRTHAPQIDLVIKPVTRIDLAEQLDLGRIDVAIGTFSHTPQRFRSGFLFDYDDVLICASAHALGPLSRASLAQMPIVVVSFGGEREGAIDGFISERGLARRSDMYDRDALERAMTEVEIAPRIALSLPHFLALPSLLAETDLVAIVPRPLAAAFAHSHDISLHELPYATARLEVQSLWHERYEGDAAHMWLHAAIRQATEPLRVP